MKTTLKFSIVHQFCQLSLHILPMSKVLHVIHSRKCTIPLSNLMSFSCRPVLFSRYLPFFQNSEPHKQLFSRFTAVRHSTGQGEHQRKEQQMLARKGEYARLQNTGERMKICISPKSPGEKKPA